MGWLPDWVTGFDRENYEEGLEADRKNRELTEDLRRRGLITEENYQVALDRYNESASYDPDEAIDDAFDEGLADGARNIRNFIGLPFDKLLPTLPKLIPWQVWLAGAFYLAWRFGLLNSLLKKWK